MILPLLLLGCSMSLPFSVPGLSNSHPPTPRPEVAPAVAAPSDTPPTPAPAALAAPAAPAAPAAAALPVSAAVVEVPVNGAAPAAGTAAVVPVPAPVAPIPGSPEALYQACFTRLEEPQGKNECGMDSDCVVAGCSAEVCVSYNSASSVMTACTTQACFQVLDQCGCHAGLCTWSLKAPGAPKSPASTAGVFTH